MRLLSVVAEINKAIDDGDPERTYEALIYLEACINQLIDTKFCLKKSKSGGPFELLSHF